MGYVIDQMSLNEVKLVLATPMYGGMATGAYMSSVLQLQNLLHHLNIPFTYRFLVNESLITRGRNRLCKYFMDISDATHLLFVDADIEFRAEDVIRMIQADKDIIGGPYACKTLLWNRVAEAAKQGVHDEGVLKTVGLQHVYNTLDDISNNEVVQEVFEVGTGLMLIKRRVFEKLQQANPDNVILMDTPSDLTASIEERRYHCFFDTMKDGDRYLSEDWVFCRKWRDMGGQVHLLTDVITKHWGTYAY